ncbi:MAG: FG-GAP repeat protein [Solirubrobacterales bacterium]|nr:FG-GAP repeat protein [Solirubrobacterales bacterium]OJU93820.1 MAG: hypothetical protein BGO23_14515 [Solirubrobacterales bacterium 67-14]
MNRLAGTVLLALAILLGTVATASAARDFWNPASNDSSQQFPLLPPPLDGNVQRDDTPNDPGYDPAEPDDEDGGAATNLYDERFDLFGFPSAQTPLTLYREGPNALKKQVSGFNAAGAWKVTRGRPDVQIAVLDTGIKWDREGLRLQVALNRNELPLPQKAGGAGCSAYDCNGDGAFNVADYAADPRVDHAAGPHGSAEIDGEDLIATFSDGSDADGNGYVDDIAGWDFFDNDNDPFDASSYFAASGHGSGRMMEAAERGNDGQGELGVCPGCQVIPVRIWDTFVADGNTVGMGMLYATDSGAEVIVAANGSIYHSAFAEAASNYAWSHGVVQTYSGDDLNTANHNYPANYGHAMLIQGVVTDTEGLGTDVGPELRSALCGQPLASLGVCLGSQLPVGTYFRGANTTQFGGKSSISMEGASGSENTGKAGGAAALVISAARDHGIQLRPDETRAILEQTAERVTGNSANPLANTSGLGVADPAADPAAPRESQWTSHFGWGRVNLGAAVSVAASGKLPPEATITSPDWYAPLTGDTLQVRGLARARVATGGHFTWKLEWGTGQEPDTWHQVGSGTSSGTVTDFGTIQLDQVRQALASYDAGQDSGGPIFSTSGTDPLDHEFTVRLIVNGDGIDTPGIDRRVFTSARDEDLRDGFPKRMGAGGEAPIRYADLDGDGTEELVVPTMAGEIHAYRQDGSELPGWPVRTRLMHQAGGHQGANGFKALAAEAPPREPPRGPVVADIDGDGETEVVTTAGYHVYAWGADGRLEDGFPVGPPLSNCRPELQKPNISHPKCGFIASPALARLDGPDGLPSIVVPGLDGYLYAYTPRGGTVPGFPVRLVDPDIPADQQMLAESITSPAVGDLNGDGRDDIVVASNETYDAQAPDFESLASGFLGSALTDILANAAGGSNRVYAVDSRGNDYPDNDGKPFLAGWPIKPNGAIQDTLPMIGPGQDPSIMKVDGETRVVASATGSATIGVYGTDGSLSRGIQQSIPGAASTADGALPVGGINLFESASLGKLVPGQNPSVVKYGLGLPAVLNLLLVGQNLPYNHLIGAYDPVTGLSQPAFPRVTEDYQFLSSSTIANVTGNPTSNQVIAGTGLGLVNAYDGLTGANAPGFPKVTGGWLFSPAAISDDGRIAAFTREGYLFEWSRPDIPACQSEWPGFRHDPQQSGNYDHDGTAPGPLRDAKPGASGVSFEATGDDGRCGQADHYEAVSSEKPIAADGFGDADRLRVTEAPAEPGAEETLALTGHKRYAAIRAVDESGNPGPVAMVDFGPSGGPGPDPDPDPKPSPKPPRNVKPGLAFLYKGRLYVRVHCPKRFRPACRVRATVVTKKRRGKAMTKTLRVKVRSGHWKRAALKVRRPFLKRLQKLSKVKRRTIFLKMRVKARRATHGPRKAVVYHRLRVRSPG